MGSSHEQPTEEQTIERALSVEDVRAVIHEETGEALAALNEQVVAMRAELKELVRRDEVYVKPEVDAIVGGHVEERNQMLNELKTQIDDFPKALDRLGRNLETTMNGFIHQVTAISTSIQTTDSRANKAIDAANANAGAIERLTRIVEVTANNQNLANAFQQTQQTQITGLQADVDSTQSELRNSQALYHDVDVRMREFAGTLTTNTGAVSNLRSDVAAMNNVLLADIQVLKEFFTVLKARDEQRRLWWGRFKGVAVGFLRSPRGIIWALLALLSALGFELGTGAFTDIINRLQ